MSTTDFATLVVAVLCTGAFVLTFRDGETNLFSFVYASRKRNPLAYWAIQSLFGLLTVGLLIGAIISSIHS
jgi:hypothetical protein